MGLACSDSSDLHVTRDLDRLEDLVDDVVGGQPGDGGLRSHDQTVPQNRMGDELHELGDDIVLPFEERDGLGEPHHGQAPSGARSQQEVLVPPGRVDDVDDDLRLAGQDVVPGDLLVERLHRIEHPEGVDARQVRDLETLAAVKGGAEAAVHGHAGPIRDVLPAPRQGVEEGCLAAVRVADDADGDEDDDKRGG